MSEYETRSLPVTLGGFFATLKIDVCKTCSALVVDKERHSIYHAWPSMTIGQKLAYARRKRAAGEDDDYSDSIMRPIP